MRITEPQMRALRAIANDPETLGEVSIHMHRLVRDFGHTGHYRVVNSLLEKKLITATQGCSVILTLTDAGRAALKAADGAPSETAEAKP